LPIFFFFSSSFVFQPSYTHSHFSVLVLFYRIFIFVEFLRREQFFIWMLFYNIHLHELKRAPSNQFFVLSLIHPTKKYHEIIKKKLYFKTYITSSNDFVCVCLRASHHLSIAFVCVCLSWSDWSSCELIFCINILVQSFIYLFVYLRMPNIKPYKF
jgi:hypothetical protein